MKTFRNVATLVRKARNQSNYSQEVLSTILGYTNGQFVSNIERGLCSVPTKKAQELCEVLDICPEDLIEAVLADKEAELRYACYGSDEKRTESKEEELVVGTIHTPIQQQQSEVRGWGVVPEEAYSHRI